MAGKPISVNQIRPWNSGFSQMQHHQNGRSGSPGRTGVRRQSKPSRPWFW